ncbi:hypothetical protein DUNSADRAFT_12797, partial [Dunaliella salina]
MQRLRGNYSPYSNRVGRTHAAGSNAGEGKGQAKLIIIALFSVGVLGSFLIPGQQPEGRLFPAAGHGDGLRAHRKERIDPSQVRSLNVDEHDERHPNNKAQVILQQSHHDEMVKDGEELQQHHQQHQQQGEQEQQQGGEGGEIEKGGGEDGQQ